MSRRPASLHHWDPAAAPTKIEQSQSQADIAYRRIKRAVLEGALAPGTQAAEQQIAVRLGMSRTPVHQAIVRLEQECWLELSPRRGIYIAPIDPDEMREIYQILMALEGTAAADLARRPRAAKDGVDEALVAANAECVAALEAGDLPAWAEADHRFHTALVENSSNARLVQLVESVAEQAHRARLLTVRLRPLPVNSNADHQAIIAAIQGRKPGTARRALEAHRQRGIDTLVPILRAMVPQPTPLLNV
jgi:DNA-binding GntR family transcriptional regulator